MAFVGEIRNPSSLLTCVRTQQPNTTAFPYLFITTFHATDLMLRLTFGSILKKMKMQKFCYYSCNGLRCKRRNDAKKIKDLLLN